MSNDDSKKLTVEFAPGCFDNFEGTQEELNEMMAEILQLAESGQLFDQIHEVEEGELATTIATDVRNIDSKRNLH